MWHEHASPKPIVMGIQLLTTYTKATRVIPVWKDTCLSFFFLPAGGSKGQNRGQFTSNRIGMIFMWSSYYEQCRLFQAKSWAKSNDASQTPRSIWKIDWGSPTGGRELKFLYYCYIWTNNCRQIFRCNRHTFNLLSGKRQQLLHHQNVMHTTKQLESKNQ